MDSLWVLILWFFLSVMVGFYAKSKERSFAGFVLISALLSPIVGLAWAVLSRPGDSVRCPECREWIISGARKCRYCASVLSAPQAVQWIAPNAEQVHRNASSRKTVFGIALAFVVILCVFVIWLYVIPATGWL
jgi:hypothetical protein